MKAQDLRIGNLVKRYLGANEYKTIVLKSISDTGEFTYIDQDEKTLYLVRNNFKGLQPIELTEDWLLKMGLINDDEDFLININERSSLHINLNKVRTLIESYDGLINIKHVKYVHQLQNLYHALTGEELTIK